MRKLYALAITMVCISAVSNAQISKGSTILGGSVSLRTTSLKDETPPELGNNYSDWGITPQFGKAIANNKIIGIFLDFTGSKQEYPNYSTQPQIRKTESSSYGGGFFYRQYFPLSNHFYLFDEGSARIGFSTSEGSSNNIRTSEQNQ